MKEGSTPSRQDQRVFEQLRLLAAEFSAPLQYLAAASEFVRSYEANLPEFITKQLSTMQLTSQRLLKTTELLLLHEGVLTGQLSLTLEPVNVAALAQETLTASLRLHSLTPVHEPITVTSFAWPAQSDFRTLKAALEALSDVLVQTSEHPLQVSAKLVKRGDNVSLELTDDGPIVSRREMAQPITQRQQPYQELTAHQALTFSIARDLIDSVQGRLSMARTGAGHRHTKVRLPMTHQLGFAGF